MACGRHFFCTFNTFIDQELPNQISYSSIKMKSLSIIIMYYIIVKQVIWNNERPFHSAFVISSHFWQLKVVEQKKLDFFSYFKSTNPLPAIVFNRAFHGFSCFFFISFSRWVYVICLGFTMLFCFNSSYR